MPNVTLSIDEETLVAGRRYARQHHTSLNGLIRHLLHNTVSGKHRAKKWQNDFFAHADSACGDSKGKRWSRKDLYDV